jgi:hypothetical protein
MVLVPLGQGRCLAVRHQLDHEGDETRRDDAAWGMEQPQNGLPGRAGRLFDSCQIRFTAPHIRGRCSRFTASQAASSSCALSPRHAPRPPPSALPPAGWSHGRCPPWRSGDRGPRDRGSGRRPRSRAPAPTAGRSPPCRRGPRLLAGLARRARMARWRTRRQCDCGGSLSGVPGGRRRSKLSRLQGDPQHVRLSGRGRTGGVSLTSPPGRAA